MKRWWQPGTKFVVMMDKNSSDCKVVKEELVTICKAAGKADALVRVACHELESFYLGDLNAVSKAMSRPELARLQQKSKYRNPDKLANPSQELEKLVPGYSKVADSHAIGSRLDIANNKSHSFNVLVAGIRRLI